MAAPGRLLGRVQGWNDETAREFARACAAHARQHTRGHAAEDAADAATAAEKGVAGDSATRVGYMAARAAERRWQSRWLADRLGVPCGSVLSDDGWPDGGAPTRP